MELYYCEKYLSNCDLRNVHIVLNSIKEVKENIEKCLFKFVRFTVNINVLDCLTTYPYFVIEHNVDKESEVKEFLSGYILNYPVFSINDERNLIKGEGMGR